MGARKRGFALGKFLPPHLGHVFMCETAANMVEGMTVLVCSIDGDPIPGALRAAWMRRLLPNLNVRHMHRDIPQAPEDHADFWPVWTAAIAEFHPEPIDTVFGSEPYVFRLADELGAEPVLIDPGREVFAASGQAILNDPAANWGFIPDVVKPYFQKRICILGPESSGKSRLAQVLAERFGVRAMPEYGRIYDAHYRRGDGWRDTDFVAIARAHMAMRQALGPHAGPLLIEDTDALQTAAWADYLLGAVPVDLEALIATMDPADLYILLSADVAWSDDGTRYSGSGETRQRFVERCRQRLDRMGLAYAEVTGADWDARTASAIALVEAHAKPYVKLDVPLIRR